MQRDQKPPLPDDENFDPAYTWQGRDGVSEIQDLGLFIDGVPHMPRVHTFVWKKVWFVSGILALVALLSAGIIVTQIIKNDHTSQGVMLPVLAGTPVPVGVAPISPENAATLTEVARWGRGAATQLVFSPDGKTIAIASSIGIYLYDYSPGGPILTLNRFINTSSWAWSVAFSPDSETLAAGLSTGQIALWLTKRDSPPRLIKAHAGQVNSIAFAPGGRNFASGSADGSVKLWQLDSGTLVRILRKATLTSTWINSIAFSHDGTALASTGDSGVIDVWQVKDGELIGTLNGRAGTIGNLQFSRDGRVLAAGSSGSGVQLWRLEDASFLGELDSKRAASGSLALSGDGEMVVTTSGFDDIITVWRGLGTTPVRTLEVRDVRFSGTKSLAFSPDGTVLALVSRDGTIRIWRVTDWALIYALDGDSYWGEKLVYSPDGKIIASASEDGKLQLWNTADGTPLRNMQGGDHKPEYMVFSRDGKLLTEVLYTPQGASVYLWRISDGSLFRNYDITEESLVLMAISPDGQAFAGQSRGGIVRVWKLQDGSPVGIIDTRKGASGITGRMALSPDGQLLACALLDDTIELWDTGNGDLIRTLTSTLDIDSLAFSPDGQKLVGISGNEIAVWRVQDGIPTLLPHPGDKGQGDRLTNVVFSPDGSMLAGINAFSGDSTITLWSLSDSWTRDIVHSQKSGVNSISFSPDGETLVSVSADRTVRLLRIRSATDMPRPTP